MDVARFLRLQGVVRAAAASASEDNAVVAADAMMHSYQRLRGEVQQGIPDEDRAEFDRMFPENVSEFAVARGVPTQQAGKFHAARGLLEQMAGWLDGYVRSVQMEAEAKEYAAARVKEERRPGF